MIADVMTGGRQHGIGAIAMPPLEKVSSELAVALHVFDRRRDGRRRLSSRLMMPWARVSIRGGRRTLNCSAWVTASRHLRRPFGQPDISFAQLLSAGLGCVQSLSIACSISSASVRDVTAFAAP
jgi:hypothetical protein